VSNALSGAVLRLELAEPDAPTVKQLVEHLQGTYPALREMFPTMVLAVNLQYVAIGERLL